MIIPCIDLMGGKVVREKPLAASIPVADLKRCLQTQHIPVRPPR